MTTEREGPILLWTVTPPAKMTIKKEKEEEEDRHGVLAI
jgi:hypothetical protein